MALGPQVITEIWKRIADEAEIAIDKEILNSFLSLTEKTEKSDFTLSVNVSICYPKLKKDIWDTLLRKNYVLAGWNKAEWALCNNSDDAYIILEK